MELTGKTRVHVNGINRCPWVDRLLVSPLSLHETVASIGVECCINDPGSLLTRCTKGQRDLDLFRDRSRSTLKDDVQDGTASRASTDASLGPADRQTDTDHATQAHNRTNSTSDDRAKKKKKLGLSLIFGFTTKLYYENTRTPATPTIVLHSKTSPITHLTSISTHFL
ncbi:hypothetical protein J6590_099374 [Homalodisca vitripennis]|nr:hypothetical protein J6590_099374 [Homalodisca vitripennis]